MEYKATKAATMGVQGRTVTGVFAVHGNIDDGQDRSHPGLFGEFLASGRRRAVFLWQHRADEPPIATIDRLFEVAGPDLPAAVKAYAPDATGGVAVTRTYLETERGNAVLAGLTSGALTEMSYAYDATRSRMEQVDDRQVRNLYAADLLDVSDVNWGMNPATSADGAKGRPLAVEHAAALAAVAAYIARLDALAALRAKEGRVLSGETRTRIADAVTALASARTALTALLDATEPKASRADVLRLMAESERVTARLNGVHL